MLKQTLLLLISFCISAQSFWDPKPPVKGITPIKFSIIRIASESFEAAGVADFNKDGEKDIISGSYWYEGPLFLKRHYTGKSNRYGEYWDDFSGIVMDVDGDNHLDLISGGWWGQTLRWKRNPGKDEDWKETIIDSVGDLETMRAWDIDKDGVPEICPNNPGFPLKFFKLNNTNGKANGTFTKITVNTIQGHGLGFGDVNSDGREDFIVSDGWLEAPLRPFTENWTYHPEFKLGTIGVPIIVTDVNKDGKADLIVGQGHSYGLDWYEQLPKDKKGIINWKKHPIDPYNAQFHTMEWVDLDGDDQNELITGKRYRAHNDADPGSYDDIGLYYYKWNGESFTKNVIQFGGFGVGKGTGIYMVVTDMNKDGKPDIVVAGKDGLAVVYNKGY